jgi:hypothetical protein
MSAADMNEDNNQRKELMSVLAEASCIHEENREIDNEKLMIIDPLEDHPVVRVFQHLEQLLRKKETRTYLQKAVTKYSYVPNASIRPIQIGRMEIFVQASTKQTTVFDVLVQKLIDEFVDDHYYRNKNVNQIRNDIITYCIEQAKRDPRVIRENVTEFNNFSLLLNYEPVAAQFPHIDMLFPNFQFLVTVSNHAESTRVYTTSFCTIASARDLQQKAWTDMPPAIVDALSDDPYATSLLCHFGRVLCPNVHITTEWGTSLPKNSSFRDNHHNATGPDDHRCIDSILLPTGTTSSLPGSVIHAGPASQGFRAILFFSGSAAEHPVGPYNPDTQYFSGTLLCDLISILWERLTVEHRVYMLTKLLDNICTTGYRTLHRHLNDPCMIRLTKYLSNTRYSESAKLDYIRKFALRQTGDVSKSNHESGQLPEQQRQLLETTSIDNGHTKSEAVGETHVDEESSLAVGDEMLVEKLPCSITNSGHEDTTTQSSSSTSSLLVDMVSKNMSAYLRRRRRRREAEDADNVDDAKRIRSLPRDVATLEKIPNS